MVVPENVYQEYHDLLENVHSRIMSIKIDMNTLVSTKLDG